MHAAQNLIQKHLRNFYMESFGSTLSDLHEQKDTAGLTRFASSEILKFVFEQSMKFYFLSD